MNFTFQTDQIKIFIDTQIPNFQSIAITKSILGIDTTNNYPYFTGWYKYDKSELLRKKYIDKIKFFFHEETFINSFKNKEKAIESSIYVDDNIHIMIQILFPTIYPFKNDNNLSYNNLMKKNQYSFSLKGTLPFSGILPSLDNRFSYLYFNNTPYTVTSTCILNDIVNHPLYFKLIQDFFVFESWRRNTAIVIKQKLYRLKLNIHAMIKKDYKSIQEIGDEINGNYVAPGMRESEKKKYINELYELFSLTLTLATKKDEEYITSIQKLQKKIKENTFSINTRFVNITQYLNDFLNLSFANNFFFIFTTSIDTVDVNTESYMDSNYKEYTDFITNVSQFDKDHKSTLNKPLQKIFDDYVNKKNFHLEILFRFVNDRYIKKRESVVLPTELKSYYVKNVDELLFLGVTKYNYTTQDNFTYETYVNFNLISGKLDNKNISRISCSYKDETLGNAFMELNPLNKSFFKKPVIDLSSMLLPPKNINRPIQGGKNLLLQFSRKKTSRISRKKKSSHKKIRCNRRKKHTRRKSLKTRV